MLRIERRGDLTLAHVSTPRSRAVGYGVYLFLVRGALIDTGFHGARRDVERLLDRARPRGVILTHQHEDHAGTVEMVARRGLPVHAAPATVEAIRAPERIGFYRRFVWSPMPPLATPLVPWAPDGLELVFTPGHSPDHHAVWDADARVLFAGDLWLGRKVRVARPGESPRALVASLRAAAALGPRTMLDSHRGPVADPVRALLDKADWVEATVSEIDRRIAAGQPDETIRDEVLGREPLTSLVTRGDLSKVNLVRAVRRSG